MLYYASDYFEQLYDYAVELIKKGKAYVDDLTADEISEHRGTLHRAGREQPLARPAVEENLDLFERMRDGNLPEGSRTLSAKIDMASPNINMRDPVIYRILYANHHAPATSGASTRMYDYAHGQSDAIEGITHSICTLEFEDHRPLYDWFIENLSVPSAPAVVKFARLNVTYTIHGKRCLGRLGSRGSVRGWDDPRMPTIAGLRRRGSLRRCPYLLRRGRGGKHGTWCRRDRSARALRPRRPQPAAPRRFAVLRPLRLVIENYPEGQTEEIEAVNNPEDASTGTRKVPFARELWIELDDFMEDPPSKFFRLAPGREVRLRYAYFVTCTDVVKDASGEIAESPLHLRPGDAGRRRPGRPPAQGDSALALGGARRYPPKCASTSASSPEPTRRRRRPRRGPQSRLRDGARELPSSSRRSPSCRSVRLHSSSVSATSARTATRRPSASSSTARSA